MRSGLRRKTKRHVGLAFRTRESGNFLPAGLLENCLQNAGNLGTKITSKFRERIFREDLGTRENVEPARGLEPLTCGLRISFETSNLAQS